MYVELRRATVTYFRDMANYGSVEKVVRKLVLFPYVSEVVGQRVFLVLQGGNTQRNLIIIFLFL